MFLGQSPRLRTVQVDGLTKAIDVIRDVLGSASIPTDGASPRHKITWRNVQGVVRVLSPQDSTVVLTGRDVDAIFLLTEQEIMDMIGSRQQGTMRQSSSPNASPITPQRSPPPKWHNFLPFLWGRSKEKVRKSSTSSESDRPEDDISLKACYNNPMFASDAVAAPSSATAQQGRREPSARSDTGKDAGGKFRWCL